MLVQHFIWKTIFKNKLEDYPHFCSPGMKKTFTNELKPIYKFLRAPIDKFSLF